MNMGLFGIEAPSIICDFFNVLPRTMHLYNNMIVSKNIFDKPSNDFKRVWTDGLEAKGFKVFYQSQTRRKMLTSTIDLTNILTKRCKRRWDPENITRKLGPTGPLLAMQETREDGANIRSEQKLSDENTCIT